MLLSSGVVLFFSSWLFFLEPNLVKPAIESAIGKNIYLLGPFIAFAYGLGVVLLPPLLVGVGSYVYAYQKWFMPNRTRLANEQLKKLSEARAAMTSAVTYMELFEKELREKSSEAERLREQVLSLQLLNSENAAELEKKLKAMESLTLNRIWFERVFAFFIGILSSLAASYFLYILQSHP